MASSLSDAQAELISSLSPDDIPIKLRCAICSKLAVNAFRLPCCEQAICETCQTSLAPSCPVCEHSPLGAEDCNPNKSLRTTIRVFLRTVEKKREANRPKEPKNSAPTTPVDAAKSSLPAAESSAKETAAEHDAKLTAPTQEKPAVSTGHDVIDKAPAARPDTGRSSDLTSHKEPETGDAQAPQQEDPNGQSAPTAEDVRHANGMVGPQHAPADETQGPGADQDNYGMDNGFANMMFPGSGDFNQMQMMISMQNGMGGDSSGGFPMMGMGMDPMTMQNMYMNGGFQGMGMNGMNGMNGLNGLGGYGGGFGQGSNNNWNGSQSWSFDQNNYNQCGLGMGTGDYGNFNAGFQTGYNQGNYVQFNDYRRNNFGRGRGRGARGYYGGHGRGGYHHEGGPTTHQDQVCQPQQGAGHFTQGQLISSATGDSGEQAVGHAKQLVNEGVQDTGQRLSQGGDADAARGDLSQAARCENETAANMSHGKGSAPGELGAIRSVLSTPDVPINAPTGPKAMRQGLPNTSLHHLRARGYQVDAAPVSAGTVKAEKQQPAPGGTSRPKSRSPERENEKTSGSSRDHSRGRSGSQGVPGPASRDVVSQSQDGSRLGSHKGSRAQDRIRSRSRSRSRSRRSSHRQRRRRSPSADVDEDDSHRRKKARSGRRHGDDEPRDPKEDEHIEKPRSASPAAESRKSGHRSYKDREHDGRRDRDRHRNDGRQKSGHQSRRSRDRHRDRDYEHSRRRDRDGDRGRDRKERRERHLDKDRERDHRQVGSARRLSGSRRSSSSDKAFDPPSGPRGHGGRASGARASHDHRLDRDQQDSPGGAGKAGTAKDPLTLEREARNRERLLKEAQRMAGFAGLAGSKRGRDGADDGGRSGRRPSRRSEARDGDEKRMRRLEAEREGGRWD